MDRLVLERENGYKIGRNDLEQVVVDSEDQPRFSRCVDQPQKVTLSLLKSLGE